MRSIFPVCLAVSWALAQAYGQPAGGGQKGNELPEVLNYNLTMEKVDKWAAANHVLLPYYKTHIDEMKNSPNPPANMPHTMEAMAKWSKATYPVPVRLVEKTGLTFTEYLTLSIAIPAAFSVESAMERGNKIPPEMHVNQANVAFVKANKAKFMAMFAEYQQLMIGRK